MTHGVQTIQEALLAYQSKQYEKAIQLSEQSLEHDPHQAWGWYVLGKIFDDLAEPEKAQEYFQRAIVEDHQESTFYREYGVSLKKNQQRQAAISQFKKAHTLNPADQETLEYLGLSLLEVGEQGEAKVHYENLLKFQTIKPETFNNLGCIYAMENNLNGAKQCYQQAISYNPEYKDAYNNLANIEKMQNQFLDSERHYIKTLQIDPDNSDALHNYGNLLIQLERYKEALGLLHKIESLADRYKNLWFNIGVCYLKLEGYQNAESFFTKAIQADPLFSDAYLRLAETHRLQGNLNKAIDYYQQAIHFNPNNPEALLLLGQAHHFSGNLEDALACYQACVDQDPSCTTAIAECGYLLQKTAQWENLEATTQALIQNIKADLSHRLDTRVNPFTLLALNGLSPYYQAIAEQKSRAISRGHFTFTRHHPPEGKIKIGYLSSDFNRHPVGLLIRDMLSLHNRNHFEVHGIYTGHIIDDYTQRIEKSVDHFHHVNRLSSQDIATHIYQNKIDILVDLSGHTGRSNMDILSYQPAAIQCHWMGYPASLGADYLPYYLTNAFITDRLPPQSAFSEKCVLIPDTLAATQPFGPLPPTSRKAWGLPEDTFIYCCFSQSYRITPELFQDWMHILKNTPDSVLWLKSSTPLIDQRYRDHATKHGVAAHRLHFLNDDTLTQHWPQQVADLWLDTYTLTSGTSTFLSLWAGLPVLNIAGQTPQSRTAASLSRSFGLHEFTVSDRKQYQEKAIFYYHNKQILKNYKIEILGKKDSSPLFNPDQLIKRLEAIYINFLKG